MVGSPGSLPAMVTRMETRRGSSGGLRDMVSGVDTGEDEESLQILSRPPSVSAPGLPLLPPYHHSSLRLNRPASSSQHTNALSNPKLKEDVNYYVTM